MQNEKGLIHRDLKPGNILIEQGSGLMTVKIIDFGLSTEFEDLEDFVPCGTWGYQPPEQAIEGVAYGKPIDVWAAGIIMYKMMTGKHPFRKPETTKKQYTTFLSKLENQPEPLLDLSKFQTSDEANNLVTFLLHPMPWKRFTAINSLDHPFILRKSGEMMTVAQKVVY